MGRKVEVVIIIVDAKNVPVSISKRKQYELIYYTTIYQCEECGEKGTILALSYNLSYNEEDKWYTVVSCHLSFEVSFR